MMLMNVAVFMVNVNGGLLGKFVIFHFRNGVLWKNQSKRLISLCIHWHYCYADDYDSGKENNEIDLIF